jgi:hypothetical protein
METHGVPQDALPPEPSSKLIIPPQPGLIEKVVEPTILSIPVFGMVVIWIMVQFRDVFRGDWSDRKQIAKAAAKAERLDKKLAVSDRKVLGVQQMFYNSVPEGGHLNYLMCTEPSDVIVDVEHAMHCLVVCTTHNLCACLQASIATAAVFILKCWEVYRICWFKDGHCESCVYSYERSEEGNPVHVVLLTFCLQGLVERMLVYAARLDCSGCGWIVCTTALPEVAACPRLGTRGETLILRSGVVSEHFSEHKMGSQMCVTLIIGTTVPHVTFDCLT